MDEANTQLSPDDPRHGTANGYSNLGCRCAACREANRVNHARYMAAYGQRNASSVITAAVLRMTLVADASNVVLRTTPRVALIRPNCGSNEVIQLDYQPACQGVWCAQVTVATPSSRMIFTFKYQGVPRLSPVAVLSVSPPVGAAARCSCKVQQPHRPTSVSVDRNGLPTYVNDPDRPRCA